MFMSDTPSFRQLYRLLDDAVDAGAWWPAETIFEIGVGAILTQNTAWRNVEQAIDALKQAEQLHPSAIWEIDQDRLKALIRPAGFMNAKASYLKDYTAWHLQHHASADRAETPALRTSLLTVTGIGPETADDMLLYIYHRPVFIWDTYARRMLTQAGYNVPKSYEAARRKLGPQVCDANFTLAELQHFHGLIVEAGKQATAVGGWANYWQWLTHRNHPVHPRDNVS